MDDHRKTTELSRLTIIEEGTELTGQLRANCPVMVRGKLSGEIDSPAITVAPGGSLHGNVKVTSLLAHGELGGEVDAGEISIAGRVANGSVLKAKTLECKVTAEGAPTVKFGAVRLEIGDEPAPPGKVVG